MNRISGENRAYLENLSGQYQREALGAVLMGSQTSVFSADDQAKLTELRESFLTAEEAYSKGDQNAGLLMESYRESAEAIATAAYESSEQYQTLKDVEMDQLAAIRDNTEGLAAATQAYRESQERSKGVMADVGEDFLGYLGKTGLVPALASEKDVDGNSHAFGLNRVPYDNYPALLHRDEQILTASEARAEDRGRGTVIQVSVTGNHFTGAGEELADQVAEVIVRKVEQAAILAVPR